MLSLKASVPNSIYSWHMFANTAACEWTFSSLPAFAIILPSILLNSLNKKLKYNNYTTLTIPGPIPRSSIFLMALGLSIINSFYPAGTLGDAVSIVYYLYKGLLFLKI